MSADRLDEIKARTEQVQHWTSTTSIEQAMVRMASSAADVPWLVDQVESLERWKAEALEVISGLQELGRALGLPLGVQITGPAALAEVERLTRVIDAKPRQPLVVLNEYLDRTEKAEAEVERLTALVQSTEDKADDYLAEIESAHAERDALAAQVARAEALADHWAKRAASDYEAGGTLTWGAADVHFSAVLREALVEPTGQEVDLPLHRTEAGSALDAMETDQ